MRLWDRKQNCYIEEVEYGQSLLEFLYQTVIGRGLLKLIFSRRIFSKMAAIVQRSRRSVKRIPLFVEKHGIDMKEWEGIEFQSFDEFFTRKRDYQSETKEDELMATADSKIFIYEIEDDLSLQIKNSQYTIEELTDDFLPLDSYRGGTCIVYRLAVDDYHRYAFLDDGTIGDTKEIQGILHTVRPISENYKVFSRNHRICTLLHTKHFSDVIQIEVGAMLVGKIENHDVSEFSKLQEKGYFRYGGSTVVQLFEKDSVVIDEDILSKNAEGVEVKVSIGDKIGRACGGKRDA